MDSHVNPRHIGEFLSKNARHRLTLLMLDKIKVEPVKKGVKSDPRGRPQSKESVLANMLGIEQRTVHRWLDPDGVQANDSNATRNSRALRPGMIISKHLRSCYMI